MAVNIEAIKKEAIETGLKGGIFARFIDIEYIANTARLTGGNEVVFRPQFLSSTGSWISAKRPSVCSHLGRMMFMRTFDRDVLLSRLGLNLPVA